MGIVPATCWVETPSAEDGERRHGAALLGHHSQNGSLQPRMPRCVTGRERYNRCVRKGIRTLGDVGAITVLLQRLSAGEMQAESELLPLVYAELRLLAARYLRGERAGHTLSPTALVHEAYLRLVGTTSLAPGDRRQFFAIAARRMRQVLVDHARHRDAAKRGGAEREAVSLSSLADESSGAGVDAIALDQALTRLHEMDERKAQVVELRYFAGLEMGDIAELLGVSRATVQRDWDVARTFLFQALT
jgi:RNA polymerase sigma factor (TIGR02999 family)